jgi:hypothetical protein
MLNHYYCISNSKKIKIIITTRYNRKRNKKIIMIVKLHESNYKIIKSGKKINEKKSIKKS